MIAKILNEASHFEQMVSRLKKESGYYPNVIMLDHFTDGRLEKYASTLVRIQRSGKWYAIHCVESIIPNSTVSESHLLLRMMDSVYKIQSLYILQPNDKLDAIQISEFERMFQIIRQKQG